VSSPFRVVGRKLNQKRRRHDSDATENGRGSFPDFEGYEGSKAALTKHTRGHSAE
jgi:hypothetical protein